MKKAIADLYGPITVSSTKVTRTEFQELMFCLPSELHISIVATSYRHKFTRFCDIQPDGFARSATLKLDQTSDEFSH